MTAERLDHDEWPARAVLLLVLGGLLGAAFHALVDVNADPNGMVATQDPLRLAGASAVAVGGIAFALTLERLRWSWSLAFALAAAFVAGAIFYWNGGPGGGYSGSEWQLIAILAAIAIAAPLFQAARDRGRWTLEYASVHAHAWSNLVLWCAAWAFVLIAYLLALLLGQLFSLIGIDLLEKLLREGWFGFTLAGGALGAAIGLLRDRDKVLGLLQRVVVTVLSVLAPVLAAGLVLFVLALPFTGLDPLWDQTSSTTPILLGCIIGAIFLANATIGNRSEEEAGHRILRISAWALAAVIAPLAVVAAVSTWLRIDQYGFTPERLWGLVFVAITVTVALAYLVALIQGRARWPDRLRAANVRLAAAICVVAFLLATPLVNFGAISTRDQLARLQSRDVAPSEFDWAAMAFDFGPSGKRALERLRREGSPLIRTAAAKALDSDSRSSLAQEQEAGRQAQYLGRRLVVRPAAVPLPLSLRTAVAASDLCDADVCTLIWSPGERDAVLAGFQCATCRIETARLVVDARGRWEKVEPDPGALAHASAVGDVAAQKRAMAEGAVEIREVGRRQMFVGGRPVGQPFE